MPGRVLRFENLEGTALSIHHFDADGTWRSFAPNGQPSPRGNWFVERGRACLTAPFAPERAPQRWLYPRPIRTDELVRLTSTQGRTVLARLQPQGHP